MRRHLSPILAIALCVWLAAAAACAGAANDSPADLQFDYAEGLYRDGLHKMAVPELEKFLKLYPKHPRASTAHFELGDCRYLAKDYKGALPEFEAAAADGKLALHPVAVYRIGDCRYRLGDTAGAVEPLRQFLGLNLVVPDQRRLIVHARYTLALAEFAQRHFEPALALFEQVLVDPSPENSYKPYVLLPIGDCLSALGKPDVSIDRYRELEKFLVAALKAKPDGIDAKAQRDLLARVRAKTAGLLLTLKKYEEALAVFGLLDTSGPFAEEVLYGRAQALFLLQRCREALVPGLEYLKRFPKGQFVQSVLYVAGECCYRTDLFADAERYFGDFLAADKDPKSPAREPAAFGRAAAAYRQGSDHAKAALEAADAYLKEFASSPHAAEAIYFHAEAAFWLKNLALALDSYRKAAVGGAHAEEATHQAAVCLDLLNRPEEAAGAYDTYLQRFPNGSHAKTALERTARLRGQLSQYAKAADRYGAYVQRFAKTDPGVAEDFLYRKGACEYEAKQYDAMAQTFKAYFDQFKEGAHKGDVHYFLAWYYAEQKHEYEAAVPLYELCANMPGKYQKLALYHLAHTYNRIGKAHLAAKQQDEANASFAKAAETFLQLIRTSPETLKGGAAEYLWTAEVFRELGRKPEAIETYEAILARFPSEAKPTIIYWLGQLSLNLDKPDYARAKKYFELFLKSYPNHEYVIWARFGLAETLKGSGDHKGAWELYPQVEQLAPHVLENATTRDGLVLKCQLQMGRMAFDDKNWEFARKYLLRVGYLGNGDAAAEALYKAGLAAVGLKDVDAAAAIWQRLLRQFPDSDWTKRLIKEVDQHGLRLAEDGKSIEKKAPTP